MLSFMKGILPRYFDSEWSFAQFRVFDSQTICAIIDNYLIVVSQDGNYYQAEIDIKNGGDCRRVLER